MSVTETDNSVLQPLTNGDINTGPVIQNEVSDASSNSKENVQLNEELKESVAKATEIAGEVLNPLTVHLDNVLDIPSLSEAVQPLEGDAPLQVNGTTEVHTTDVAAFVSLGGDATDAVAEEKTTPSTQVLIPEPKDVPAKIENKERQVEIANELDSVATATALADISAVAPDATLGVALEAIPSTIGIEASGEPVLTEITGTTSEEAAIGEPENIPTSADVPQSTDALPKPTISTPIAEIVEEAISGPKATSTVADNKPVASVTLPHELEVAPSSAQPDAESETTPAQPSVAALSITKSETIEIVSDATLDAEVALPVEPVTEIAVKGVEVVPTEDAEPVVAAPLVVETVTAGDEAEPERENAQGAPVEATETVITEPVPIEAEASVTETLSNPETAVAVPVKVSEPAPAASEATAAVEEASPKHEVTSVATESLSAPLGKVEELSTFVPTEEVSALVLQDSSMATETLGTTNTATVSTVEDKVEAGIDAPSGVVVAETENTVVPTESTAVEAQEAHFVAEPSVVEPSIEVAAAMIEVAGDTNVESSNSLDAAASTSQAITETVAIENVPPVASTDAGIIDQVAAVSEEIASSEGTTDAPATIELPVFVPVEEAFADAPEPSATEDITQAELLTTHSVEPAPETTAIQDVVIVDSAGPSEVAPVIEQTSDDKTVLEPVVTEEVSESAEEIPITEVEVAVEASTAPASKAQIAVTAGPTETVHSSEHVAEVSKDEVPVEASIDSIPEGAESVAAIDATPITVVTEAGQQQVSEHVSSAAGQPIIAISAASNEIIPSSTEEGSSLDVSTSIVDGSDTKALIVESNIEPHGQTTTEESTAVESAIEEAIPLTNNEEPVTVTVPEHPINTQEDTLVDPPTSLDTVSQSLVQEETSEVGLTGSAQNIPGEEADAVGAPETSSTIEEPSVARVEMALTSIEENAAVQAEVAPAISEEPAIAEQDVPATSVEPIKQVEAVPIPTEKPNVVQVDTIASPPEGASAEIAEGVPVAVDELAVAQPEEVPATAEEPVVTQPEDVPAAIDGPSLAQTEVVQANIEEPNVPPVEALSDAIEGGESIAQLESAPTELAETHTVKSEAAAEQESITISAVPTSVIDHVVPIDVADRELNVEAEVAHTVKELAPVAVDTDAQQENTTISQPSASDIEPAATEQAKVDSSQEVVHAVEDASTEPLKESAVSPNETIDATKLDVKIPTEDAVVESITLAEAEEPQIKSMPAQQLAEETVQVNHEEYVEPGESKSEGNDALTVANDVERPKSPWTPSFQVTSVGCGVTPDEELESAIPVTESDEHQPVEEVSASVSESAADNIEEIAKDVHQPTISPPELYIDKSSLNEPTETEEVAEAHVEEPPQPWTPSYSVHSQGSPRPENVELEVDTQEPPARPWTPSYSVHSQGSPLPRQIDLVEEFTPVVEAINAQEEEAVELEEMKFADNEDAPAQVQEPKPAEVAISFTTNAQRIEPSLEQTDALLEEEVEVAPHTAATKGVIDDQVQETAVDEGDLKNSAVHDVPPVATQVPQLVLDTSEEAVPTLGGQEARGEERPASPWVASYSVSVQGSPAQERSNPLDQVATSSEPAVLTKISAQGSEDGSMEQAPAEETSDDNVAKAQSQKIEILDVAPHGTDTEVKALNEVSEEIKVDEVPAATPVVLITPDDATEVVSNVTTIAATLLTGSENDEAPKSPWTPSYSVTIQGANSASDEAELDELEHLPQRAESTEAAEIKDGVSSTPSKLEEGVISVPANAETFPSIQSIVEEPKKSTLRLTTLDENAVSDGPLASPDAISPVTSRSRLESTTSSRFFPGGWFSPTKTVDESRASLEVAQGVFTAAKTAVASNPSIDEGPDSPAVDETAQDPENEEPHSALSEQKRRWCVIM